MPTNRHKRTDLFLLRVWCDEEDDGSGLTWRGRVQRTVSGEARNFEGREALIEALEVMLYKDQSGHSRSPKKASSEADLPGGESNANEANR